VDGGLALTGLNRRRVARAARWLGVVSFATLATAPVFGGATDRPLTLVWLGFGAAAALATFFTARKLPPFPMLPEAWFARGLAALAAVAFLSQSIVALAVFDGLPLHVDALTQAVQAWIFAQGRLRMEVPGEEYVGSLLTVHEDGQMYSSLPPGWSALLAVGRLLGAQWLVGVLAGTTTVVAGTLLGRRLVGSARGGLAVGAMLALSPWLLLNAGSQMNHVGVLALVTVAWALCARIFDSPTALPTRSTTLAAGVTGVILGLAAAIRPLDAAAAALPVAVLVVGRALTRVEEPRSRHRSEAMGFVLGIGLGGLPLLVYNYLQHGGALTFGYDVLWGPVHGLGFHEAPWGPRHTVGRGLMLSNAYLMGLQEALFESPVPLLLLVALWLGIEDSKSPTLRAMLATSGLLLLGYFAYWHDGRYLGPRFLLPALPLVVIGLARVPAVLEAVVAPGSSHLRRWLTHYIVVGVVAGCVYGAPRRLEETRRTEPMRRIDVARAIATSGPADALVLVSSSWASQLRARAWALGIPHYEAEWLFARIDHCAAEHTIERLQLEGADPDRVARNLLALTIDSLSLRFDPQREYSLRRVDSLSLGCRARRAYDEQGTFSILPFLAAQGVRGNVFVRDLLEWNGEILGQNPTKPVFVARPTREPDGTVGVRFDPAPRDSLAHAAEAWHAIMRVTRDDAG
jgi:hypothetical protein